MKEDIPVWVFVAPLLPGLTNTDDSLAALLGALKRKGIRQVSFDPLSAYPAVGRRLRKTYSHHFPGLLSILEEYLRHPQRLSRETEELIHRTGTTH